MVEDPCLEEDLVTPCAHLCAQIVCLLYTHTIPYAYGWVLAFLSVGMRSLMVVTFPNRQ